MAETYEQRTRGLTSSRNGHARGEGSRRLLKITGQGGTEKDSLSLILEGRLAGPWVEELNGYWSRLTGSQREHAAIDLSGVTFIDATGKALLDRLWRQGARLRATGCLTRCIVEEITGARGGSEEIDPGERRCP
jgi:ABC-type transporter Mla MlaB component